MSDLQTGHVPSPTRRSHTKDVYPSTPAIGKRETSHAAAEKIKPAFNKKQKIVLRHLSAFDMTSTEIFKREAGLSDEELKRYCELRSIERGLQPRPGELEAIGMVFDSGKRRPNPGGRDETVWTVRNPKKSGTLL